MKTIDSFEKKDQILVCLYFLGLAWSKSTLTKCVVISSHALKLKNKYELDKKYSSPWSLKLNEDLEFFEDIGFIKRIESESNFDRPRISYKLTDIAKKFLKEKLFPDIINDLKHEYVDFFKSEYFCKKRMKKFDLSEFFCKGKKSA